MLGRLVGPPDVARRRPKPTHSRWGARRPSDAVEAPKTPADAQSMMMMRVAARIAALWCAAAAALQRPAQRARPQRSALRAAHVCAPGDYVKVDWSIACTSGKPIPADELMFDQGEVAFQVGAGNYLPAPT